MCSFRLTLSCCRPEQHSCRYDKPASMSAVPSAGGPQPLPPPASQSSVDQMDVEQPLSRLSTEFLQPSVTYQQLARLLQQGADANCKNAVRNPETSYKEEKQRSLKRQFSVCSTGRQSCLWRSRARISTSCRCCWITELLSQFPTT